MSPIFSFLKRRIRSLAMTVCFIASAAGFLYILPQDSPRASFSGVDVLHDSSAPVDGFVSFQVLKDSQDLSVSMGVQDWGKAAADCRVLEFHFPGVTKNHSQMIDFQSWDDPRIFTPGANSKPLQGQVTHDDLLDEDVIRLETSKLTEFAGSIKFVWVNGLRKIGFGRFKINAQFGATEQPGLSLKHSSKFKVSLVVPSIFELPVQIPQPVGQKSLGNASYYWFEINPAKTVLTLVFEDAGKARKKEFLLILFSTVFGIGCTLAIEQLLSVGRTDSAHRTSANGNASHKPQKSRARKKRK